MDNNSGLILGLCTVYERRRYFVTTSLWLGVSPETVLQIQMHAHSMPFSRNFEPRT